MTRLKLFDFYISEEEQNRYEMACMAASAYMEKLVRTSGRLARIGGRYYAPGEKEEEEKWIPEQTAIDYLHLTQKQLWTLATEKKVRRRIYNRKGKRIFYEYALRDLDLWNSLEGSPSS